MKEAAEYWKDTDVTIHSDPNITVEQIAIDARRAVRERDVKMIIVDYIQLVPVDKFQKDGLREQVVAFISRTLRNISLEHNIAVVALSQTNDDGAMRESRAIANDSEVILNVTKDGVFVFKQRNGQAKVMLPMFQQDGSFHFIDEADEGSMIDFGKEVESEEETYEDKEDDGIPF
jgi:replicative DNA helicase